MAHTTYGLLGFLLDEADESVHEYLLASLVQRPRVVQQSGRRCD